MSGSGHLALQTLLESPHLDVIQSPYRYDAVVRNASLGGYSCNGVWDSPVLHGKTWIVEDDTRTSLASKTNLACLFTEKFAREH